MPFFVEAGTYVREITSPDGETAEVTLRRLNAGDQAAIQDALRMSMDDENSDASPSIGTMRVLTVRRALLDWTIPGSKPTPETISMLEPEVFEQIYSHCEIGTPPTPEQKESASSNGEAPKATAATAEDVAPPKPRKAAQPSVAS